MKPFSLMNPATVVATLILASSAIGIALVQNLGGMHFRKLEIYAPDNRQFHQLPADLPSWKRLGRDEIMSKEAVEELGTDNYISRHYVSKEPINGKQVLIDLHCAYYTGMIDTVPHVPERCLVGAGWEQAGASREIRVPIDPMLLAPARDVDPEIHGELYTMRSKVTHSRVRMPRGVEDLSIRVTPFRNQQHEASFYAGYFFIANGGVVASANGVRVLAFNLDDDYAYYAKIQFTSPNVESAEELGEAVASLLEEMLPEIVRCVPDWVDVTEGRYPPPGAS